VLEKRIVCRGSATTAHSLFLTLSYSKRQEQAKDKDLLHHFSDFTLSVSVPCAFPLPSASMLSFNFSSIYAS